MPHRRATDEPDLTKLSATEYLAAAAARLKDLYRVETRAPQGGSEYTTFDPFANEGSVALSPEAEGSLLPTLAVGAGPGRLGFSAETNFPGGGILAARDYTQSPAGDRVYWMDGAGSPGSDVTTKRDTLEAAFGPVSAFYSTGDGDTTKYGGETSLGPLFGGLLQAGGSRTAGAQDPVNSYFAKWSGKAGPGTLGLDAGLQGRDKNAGLLYEAEDLFGLGGRTSVGAGYLQPEGGRSSAGGSLGYRLKF